MSRIAQWTPDNLPAVVRKLVSGQMDVQAITTPATAGNELEIRHGLGRIPQGYIIVQRPYAALNHGIGGSTWTRDSIFVKFSTTSTALTIAIF